MRRSNSNKRLPEKKQFLNYLIWEKNRSRRPLPNSFYKGSVTFIPNPHKDTTKRKLQTNIPEEHRLKNDQ